MFIDNVTQSNVLFGLGCKSTQSFDQGGVSLQLNVYFLNN